MNLTKLTSALVAGTLGLVVLQAQAHSFSVQAYSKTTPHGSSAVTHLAWGHAMPMDDFLAGDSIETYDLHDPEGGKFSFEVDSQANQRGARTREGAGMTVQAGDAFVNKINFKDGMKKGTYTVAASMKQSHFTMYIDEKGKRRWGPQTMDEIENAQKILKSVNYQNFAKAFITVGEWTEPKPVGHGLEILPLTDLSKLKAGDEAKFKVTLNGEPIPTGDDGKPTLTAFGENFGENKGYSIKARINKKGVGTIRVPEAGNWMIEVSMIRDVGPDNRPELVGKTMSSGVNATATFSVLPN